MKSDFFVFYIAYLPDGKQRDFWEQGQNPAVLSPSWILANQWIFTCFGLRVETGPCQQEGH